MKSFLLFSVLLLTFTSTAHAQRYYTVSEVLTYLFKDSQSVDFEKKSLTTDQVKKLKHELKIKKLPKQWTVYVAKTNGRVDGYAIIDHVLGKEQLITYAVSILPDGSVKEVEIMVYRESHGGQVKNKNFRKQFVGKTAKNSLRLGHEITKVSGATISSRNLSLGVKKLLMVWRFLY